MSGKPKGLTIKLIMPSSGDMELLTQEGGTITLSPIFYGKESIGPHLQVCDGDTVLDRYRIKVKMISNKPAILELKKGQSSNEN